MTSAVEKNDDLLFSQQSRHSRPSSLCEASSSCFFSATPSAIKTGQNCSKIVGITYVFMDRENLLNNCGNIRSIRMELIIE